MAYEVLARKWRPQQFSDVLGQEHVSRTLANAIKSDRVAHAYLFVGPRGTGKTSTARIFAKALNCEQGPTTTPCDTCDACREIMAGNSFDVLEIDGASNNGIDQVRDLRENVQYTPARGPYKIYIIDEVHMLSTQAFNALLKTLEEPPPHVKFIFATTEPQKVPATILSRCQRFDLRRIPLNRIVDHLQTIADSESVTIAEEAMLAIARGADGGMRDAQSALDQLISFRGKTIHEDDVLSVFGLVSWSTLEDVVDGVLQANVPTVMQIVSEMDNQGKDLQRLVVELLGHFRDLLIASHSEEALAGMDITKTQAEALQARLGSVEPGRILRVVDILAETENRMRYALSRRTLLETALIRCARAANVVTIDELMRQVQGLREALVEAGAAVPVMQGGRAEPTKVQPAPEAAAPEAPREQPPAVEPPAGDDLSFLQSHWGEFIEQSGHRAKLVRHYLLDARPIEVSEATVTIGFDPEFAESANNINTARNRGAIQKVLANLLGRSVGVVFRLMTPEESAQPLPTDHPRQGKSRASGRKGRTGKTGVPGATSSDTATPDAVPQTRLQWLDNEAVRRTLERFNGDIIDVRE